MSNFSNPGVQQPATQSSTTQPVPQDACCIVKSCCCGCMLITGLRIILVFDILQWLAIGIDMIASLAVAGGSTNYPGGGAKYISLITYIGSLLKGFGAYTSFRVVHHKEYIRERHVWLRASGIVISSIGNIIALSVAPSIVAVRSASTIVYAIAFIIWLLIDIYFSIVCRSYGYERDEAAIRFEPYTQGNQMVVIQSQAQPYAQYPGYGAPQQPGYQYNYRAQYGNNPPQYQPQPGYQYGQQPGYPSNQPPQQYQNPYGPPPNTFPTGTPMPQAPHPPKNVT